MDAWHTQPPSVTIIPNCSFIFTPSSLLYCYITISFAFIKILCVQSIMYLVNFFCNIFHSLFNSSSFAYNFWLVYIFKCILFLLVLFSPGSVVNMWENEQYYVQLSARGGASARHTLLSVYKWKVRRRFFDVLARCCILSLIFWLICFVCIYIVLSFPIFHLLFLQTKSTTISPFYIEKRKENPPEQHDRSIRTYSLSHVY